MYKTLRAQALAILAMLSLPFAASAATVDFSTAFVDGGEVLQVDVSVEADAVESFLLQLLQPASGPDLEYIFAAPSSAGWLSVDRIVNFSGTDITITSSLLSSAPGDSHTHYVRGLDSFGEFVLPEEWAQTGVFDSEYGTQLATLFAANVQDPAPVPLPAGVWLLLTGFGGFGWLKRRSLISAVRRKCMELTNGQAVPA